MRGGEESFLRWVRRRTAASRDLPVPPGDDAAVIRWPRSFDVVVTTDAVSEGSHFLPTDPPRLVGRKALAVSLSDVAAMGAEPKFAFVAATLRSGFQDALPRELTRGVEALARRWGVVLAGGDTNAHRGGLVVATTVVGRVRRGRAVTRAGARPGDLIAVTGALGGSLASRRHLTFTPRIAEGLLLARLGPPSAMMDVSDGFLLDLSRLATASGVGARVWADVVPAHPDAGRSRRAAVDAALGEGEDFELLFTAPPPVLRRILRRWDLGTPISIVGEVVRRGFTIVRDGIERRARPLGFQHR